MPFDSIFSAIINNKVGGNLSLLTLLKLFRILRLSKIILYLNTSENIKHSLKIFKLLFFLLIYIHCQGCAWFYYTKFDKTWFPVGGVLLGQKDFYSDDVSVVYQYCFSVYHSVTILIGEEMLPATELQAVILSILLLLGEFIHAHIMGTIGIVLQSMNRRVAKQHEQIEIACQTMKNI